MEAVNFEDPFLDEPVVHAYSLTCGCAWDWIKGWGMHRRQADRYVALAGRLRVVLYDGRPASTTFGQFAEFFFADEAPGFLPDPAGVWHAYGNNVGEVPCRVINFPTRPYDRDAPDKYRDRSGLQGDTFRLHPPRRLRRGRTWGRVEKSNRRDSPMADQAITLTISKADAEVLVGVLSSETLQPRRRRGLSGDSQAARRQVGRRSG